MSPAPAASGPSLRALLAAPATDSRWRTLQSLGFARVLLAAAVVISLAAFGAPPLGRAGADANRAATALIVDGAIYFLLALAVLALSIYRRQQFMPQVVGQLCVDVFFVTLLTALSGGVSHGMVIMYLLPLAAASLLLPTLVTFFVCAIVVIALLIDTTLRGLAGESTELFQTGLYGAGLFGITGLLRLMAIRLARQEELAQERGRTLENQLEINRLVIAQMAQGVLVVDAGLRVHANNRATRRLLRLGEEFRLTGRCLDELPATRDLGLAFASWLERGRGAEEGTDSAPRSRGQVSDLSYDLPELGARARFVRPASADAGEFVIFLEDTRALEDRAQRLKLAAMGRLTASIAHEIRNPLAAISHAGQLLAEDAREPVQVRLAAIVRENTARLSRLVEDVLRVARREPPLGDEFDLADFLSAWLAEFIRDRQLAADLIALLPGPGVRIKFEQGHLRQILYNLADNALRYASGRPGSVALRVEQAGGPEGRLVLWVVDDGPGVAADARAALFEPFFTTHSRGTGLGLYLAREFCAANRADLAYDTWRGADPPRTGFAIRFAPAAVGGNRDVDFLDTIPAR